MKIDTALNHEKRFLTNEQTRYNTRGISYDAKASSSKTPTDIDPGTYSAAPEASARLQFPEGA
jgi:hypothetical protein